jgi:ATP-dependent Clp protease ATP-binding subunit ClpA
VNAVTITKELQEALFSAINDAKRRRHEYLTLEHVLFAMAGDKHAKKILRAVGADLKELQADLEIFFAENIDPLPEGVEREPQQTPTFQRVLQRAAIQVQSAGKDTIDAGHLLASFFREPSSHAVYLLEKQGVTRLDVLEYISHGTAKVSEDGDSVGQKDDEQGYEISEEEGEAGGGKKSALEAFASDLTKRAQEGKIDPLVGRQNELERTVQVLCRRRKNNPIFVGDPGVGKTAIVEGLALRVAEGKVPGLLKDAKIYSLDMGSLIAGTKFRGEFVIPSRGLLGFRGEFFSSTES